MLLDGAIRGLCLIDSVLPAPLSITPSEDLWYNSSINFNCIKTDKFAQCSSVYANGAGEGRRRSAQGGDRLPPPYGILLLGFINQHATRRKMLLPSVCTSVSLSGAHWYQVLISSVIAGGGIGREPGPFSLPLAAFSSAPAPAQRGEGTGRTGDSPWQNGLDQASSRGLLQ